MATPTGLTHIEPETENATIQGGCVWPLPAEVFHSDGNGAYVDAQQVQCKPHSDASACSSPLPLVTINTMHDTTHLEQSQTGCSSAKTPRCTSVTFQTCRSGRRPSPERGARNYREGFRCVWSKPQSEAMRNGYELCLQVFFHNILAYA